MILHVQNRYFCRVTIQSTTSLFGRLGFGDQRAPPLSPGGTQPGQVFVLARRDGDNTSGLFVFDTANGQYIRTIGSSADYDMAGPIYDLRRNSILASCHLAERFDCNPIDETFARH